MKGNQGGQYRTSEDVDIVASTDSLGGGYVINNFATGEWLAYTINVGTAGRYTIGLRVSNNYNVAGGVAYHLEIDGVAAGGSVVVPITGGWSTFQWVNSPVVTLPAGRHVLKVVSDKQYFNLNTIRVVAAP